MPVKIVQVFNRYLFPGGEEKSADRIRDHIAGRHDVTRCFFDSREWKDPGAPGPLGQARRLFCNLDSRERFEGALDAEKPDVALFHNIYPVASPSLYHAALRRGLPVIQYLHNFRPFSVGGTLYSRGRIVREPLTGSYWREVWEGAWQGSRIKSALFALMLKRLHRSGWLDSVSAWVAISEFMRDRLIEAGAVSGDRIHVLRHSWDAMKEAPAVEDGGGFLFLGRLVDVKGVEVLLQAWDRLKARLGEGTPRLEIGGEGPLEAMVRERSVANGRIRYLGQISGDEKKAALNRCRALIVPSVWWEPLGLVVYEAYDFAKPVLAARAGGLAETVQPGVTGLLHAAGDVAALAGDIETLNAMPVEQRAVMGAAGRRWLLREAGVEKWLDGFEAILRAAQKERPVRQARAAINEPS